MRNCIICILLLLQLAVRAQISSQIVTVNEASVTPDSILTSEGTSFICPGTSVLLSLSGGSLGADAQWMWYADGCATGTSIGNGSSISVTPNAATSNYYCTAVGGCNEVCSMITILWDTSGCAALPVRLLSFDAMLYQKHKGLITWTTVDEEPKTVYVLEESSDGRKFTLLGKNSAKEIPGISDYSFIDPVLTEGLNFYRLKTIFPDSSVSYSQIKLLNLDKQQHLVKLYPNPTEGLIHFEFVGQQGQQIEILITNIVGQKIYKRQLVRAEPGLNKVTIHMSDLASGAYVFHYSSSNGKSEHIKFVKTN